MLKKASLLAIALLLSSAAAKAQFVLYGNEPASTEWSEVSTANYRVLYPQGCDSLAHSYARALELSRESIGATIGLLPNEGYGNKMPVVLHTGSAYSNGTVVWSPRRLEVYTQPSVYNSESTPWVWQIAVHESRHIAQMQLGTQPRYFWYNALFGEFWPDAMALIYPTPAFLEGDAVYAETSLTGAGRGRTADFLEYYRASLAEGNSGKYWRWMYGSLTRFSPDHYTIGYATSAGLSLLAGYPFDLRYYDSIISSGKAFPWRRFHKTVSEITGTGIKQSWHAIADTLGKIWSADAAARTPFDSSTAITATPRFYTDYTGLTVADGGLYAIRESLDKPRDLVKIDTSGKVRRIRSMSWYTSALRADNLGRLWWSEQKNDIRYDMLSSSDICLYDTRSGSSARLTRGRRLFNPAPLCDGQIAALEYLPSGSSRIAVLSAEDGSDFGKIDVPAGLQPSEVAAIGTTIYVSAINEDGAGIYETDGFSPVLQPQKVKINHLSADSDGCLRFVSDLGGVNEWYRLNPADGTLERLTSSLQGGTDFCTDGRNVYFTYLTTADRGVRGISADSLRTTVVDFSDVHRYAVADRISSFEPLPIDFDGAVEISEPKPYKKITHLQHFHSWMPLYADYDNLSSLSFETLTSSARPGVMGFFQNELGTASGYVAYSLDSLTTSGLHLKFNYTGLMPAIETSVDMYDRGQLRYRLDEKTAEDGSKSVVISHSSLNNLSLSAKMKMYVPFDLSSGGWSRGIVPSATLALSNSRFTLDLDGYDFGQGTHLLGRYLLGIRGYTMRPVAESCAFPRWGAGAEVGIGGRPGLHKLFTPLTYSYLYGYTPGFTPLSGMKFTAMVQKSLWRVRVVDNLLSMMPSGILNLNHAWASVGSDLMLRGRVEYSQPFASLEWGLLGTALYLRNLEIRPHFDCAALDAGDYMLMLSSAGYEFTAVCKSFGGSTVHIGWEHDFNFRGVGSLGQSFGFVFSVDI